MKSENTKINFKCKNLEKTILNKLGRKSSWSLWRQNVTVKEIAGINEISIDDKSWKTVDLITNISELQYAANISKISIPGRYIDDISSLRTLHQLSFLSISENLISDISPLYEINNLTHVDLSGFSALISEKHLENPITEISSLRKHTKLQYLNLTNNSVQELKPIEKLVNLRKLMLSGNRISDISSIARLEKLEELILSYNNFIDLKPLENLQKLKKLDLTGTKTINPLGILSKREAIDLSYISNLRLLEELALGNNKLENTNCLKNLMNLKKLDLSYANFPESLSNSEKDQIKSSLPNCKISF